MGDLFQYSQYKNNKEIKGGYLSDLSSGVSYKSSNKNVITVSSKGDITVKKTGKAVITTKYKGIPVSTTITAVKKNGLKSNKYSSLRSKAKNVAKVYGNGITSKNRYKLAQAVMTCQNASLGCYRGIYQSDRICFLLLRTDRKCSSFSCTGNDKGSKDQFKTQ